MRGVIAFLALLVIPFLLVPILATFFGLEKWGDIFQQFRKDRQVKVPLVTSLRKYYLDKAGFNHRLYILIISFAVYGFLDYKNVLSQLPGLSSLTSSGLLNKSQDYVLYVTFLAILVYTLETYRLRDETYKVADATKKQADLNFAPFVTVGWDENNARFPKRLYVKNMGRGIAINVRVRRDPTIASTGYQEVEYKFKPITSISAEDRSGVEVPYHGEWRPVSNKNIIPIELANLDLMNPDHSYRLSVDYKDVVNGEYQTVVQSDRGYNQNFRVLNYKTPFGATGLNNDND